MTNFSWIWVRVRPSWGDTPWQEWPHNYVPSHPSYSGNSQEQDTWSTDTWQSAKPDQVKHLSPRINIRALICPVQSQKFCMQTF